MPRGRSSILFLESAAHFVTPKDGVISEGQILRECVQKWNAQVTKPLPPNHKHTFITLLCDAGTRVKHLQEGSTALLDLVPRRRGEEDGSGSVKRDWKLKPTTAFRVMSY